MPERQAGSGAAPAQGGRPAGHSRRGLAITSTSTITITITSTSTITITITIPIITITIVHVRPARVRPVRVPRTHKPGISESECLGDSLRT